MERPVSGWVAAGLLSYLRGIAPGARLLGGPELERSWAEIGRSRRRFFVYYWTESGIPLILWGCMGDGRLGRELAFVHDETIGGRVTGEVVRRLGRTGWPLHVSSAGGRARDVARLIRAPIPIGIAVDGRGPYGRVGREFSRLAERCEAIAVPLALHATRSVRVKISGPVDLPRRGTDLAVALGAPVDCAQPQPDLQTRLQFELETACASARRVPGPVAAAAHAGG